MPESFPAPDEGEEILRQMREVRAELRDDVQELVGSAREMADWTTYVRAYPWLCAGAAFALGALAYAVAGQWTAMFLCLGAALFIDGIDGTIARYVKVAEVLREMAQSAS